MVSFEDRVNFNVPHLLVLHDVDSRESFWVNVAQDRLKSTGLGRKILVPASQRIDEEARGALEEVAQRRAGV